MKKPSISGSTLKLLAVITMLIDHIGAAVIGPLRYDAPAGMEWISDFCRTYYRLTRDIGRLAFPIFCFLLVEGFLHTRSAVNYAKRLALFALISEIPFDWALKSKLVTWNFQNVYFTLLIGLLVMMGLSFVERRPNRRPLDPYLHLAAQLLISAAGLYLAKFLHTDYSYKGVFLIEVLYLLRMDHKVQTVFGALAISWETTAPLAFVPIWFYNGKRGRQFKYFFYWFYPVHLVLLGIVRHFVLPLFL